MKVRRTQGLQLAKKIAESSPHPRWKIGAVITDKKDNLLAIGVNSTKTHPLSKGGTNNIHAEMDALRKAVKAGIPKRIYVARVLKDGRISLAKPCKKCQDNLDLFGIDEVYYTC